jgi:hypothetical protein
MNEKLTYGKRLFNNELVAVVVVGNTDNVKCLKMVHFGTDCVDEKLNEQFYQRSEVWLMIVAIVYKMMMSNLWLYHVVNQ